jgi:hypothetical protein
MFCFNISRGRQHFTELRTGDIINILAIHDQGNYHREDDREKPLSPHKSMFRGKITTKAWNELSWETERGGLNSIQVQLSYAMCNQKLSGNVKAPTGTLG